MNRKGQVRTDTNWINNTANKFYEKNVNASFSNSQNK